MLALFLIKSSKRWETYCFYTVLIIIIIKSLNTKNTGPNETKLSINIHWDDGMKV